MGNPNGHPCLVLKDASLLLAAKVPSPAGHPQTLFSPASQAAASDERAMSDNWSIHSQRNKCTSTQTHHTQVSTITNLLSPHHHTCDQQIMFFKKSPSSISWDVSMKTTNIYTKVLDYNLRTGIYLYVMSVVVHWKQWLLLLLFMLCYLCYYVKKTWTVGKVKLSIIHIFGLVNIVIFMNTESSSM